MFVIMIFVTHAFIKCIRLFKFNGLNGLKRSNDFLIFRPLRDDPCDLCRSEFSVFFGRGVGVGYCMIETTQMALSYYLN